MMPLGEAFYQRKVQQIQQRLSETDMDGLLLLDTHNVIYASGFLHSPSERPLGFFIPSSGSPALFVPLLEQENAQATWITDIRTYFEYPGEENPIAWMVRETGCKRLGIDRLAHDIFIALPATVHISPIVEQMRWVKDAEELALVERAASYADFCLEHILEHGAHIIRSGGTELDILQACMEATYAKMSAELTQEFGERGFRVTGTVHSGPRAALPHGSPIARQPQPGEPLIAGIGAMVGGYHAESGATFVVGNPSTDVLRCLHAAAACNDAAISALTVGTTCASVNDAALNVLRKAELGDAIRHRIGHGMGIQGHEGPWLAPGDTTLVQPGMVFSNEPGIYRPGIDGYRTINTMIVTDGPAHVPSHFLAQHPPEARILPV